MQARREQFLQQYSCSFCDFRCYDDQRMLLKHMRDLHANDPNFLISCSICGQNFKKWSALKKHLHRFHRGHSHNTEDIQDSSDSPVNSESHFDTEVSFAPDIDPRWESALFLLRMTEEHSLTHTGVDSLCESAQWLVDSVGREIAQKLETRLSAVTDDALKEDLLQICKPSDDIFSGLNSRHLRESFYRDWFNYVAPKTVLLGKSWEWKVRNEQKTLSEVSHEGCYVDLLEGLKAQLENPSIRKEILTDSCSQDGVMRDVCDGQYVKQHKFLSAHPAALQFMVYHDDIEVANPLGSKAGVHKLGVFYYVLGNIRLAYRSSFKAIQLIAVARTVDIHQYGCDSLVEPFITQMNLLGSEQGCAVNVGDEKLILHGIVVCLCGDTPASNFLGGFKEGVGFSLRKCRRCMATRTDINQQFHASELTLRAKNHTVAN